PPQERRVLPRDQGDPPGVRRRRPPGSFPVLEPRACRARLVERGVGGREDRGLTVVDLRHDCEQVRELWRSRADSHVPLALAAALAFHEARDQHSALMPRAEYEDALNLTAAALSRALTIYAVNRHSGIPVPARFDLGAGRFRCGASAY